jgi:hypothetical protein
MKYSMLCFLFMMRGSSVPDSLPKPTDAPPLKRSPVVEHLSVSGKFLAAKGVAIVNGAALLYILVRLLLSGIRRLAE